MKVIYLDNNATTKTEEEVFEEIAPYFCKLYGNPSSMHTFGGQVRKKVDEARERIVELIGAASPSEIIFTSCGTESDNAAIMGVLKANPNKRHIVTTKVEHPAVRNMCKHLVKNGYFVTELGVDKEGLLNIDRLRDSVTDDTALVSVMYANNETGVIFPIDEIAGIVKEKGSVFHTDAVQAIGKIPVDLKNSNIDLLSISGHKVHAPKGVGALYVKRGTKYSPYIIGGHQEISRRGGTENVPSIIGLGKACEIAGKYIEYENTFVKGLRDKLEDNLLKLSPDVRRNGHKDKRLPNTSNVSFEYVEGEAILLMLSDLGICASSGSACTSGSLEPSHVMRAMGVPFTAAHGSIRFSLSRYTTAEEIDFVIEKMPPIIKRLREISPFGKPNV